MRKPLSVFVLCLTCWAGDSQGQAPPEAPLAPAEMIDKAEGLIAARAEDNAIALLRQVVERKSEDPVAAAKAQLRIAECLLSNYQRPNEAETEFRAALTEFADQPETVNWARVGLTRIQVSRKKWDEVPGLLEAVFRDGQSGRATPEQMSWVLLFGALMHERIAQDASLGERKDRALAERAAAAEFHMRAVDWAPASASSREAVRHLVDLLVLGDRYSEAERAASPGWLPQAKRYVAVTLTNPAQQAEPEPGNSPSGPQRANGLLRLGREAERVGQVEEALAWFRLAVLVPGRSAEQERDGSANVARLLAQKGDSGEVEAWWRHVASPQKVADPTVRFTEGALGLSVDAFVADDPVTFSIRQVSLGRLYCEQARYPEARTAFMAARASASTARDRAEAAAGLANCYFGLGYKEQSLDFAAETARSCFEIVMGNDDGEAHYAIFLTASVYSENTFDKETLEVLEQLEEMLPVEWNPSRAAVAKYRLLMQCVSMGLNDKAARLGEEILDLFLDKPFGPGSETLCTRTAAFLACVYAEQGRVADAEIVLTRAYDRLGDHDNGFIRFQIEAIRSHYGSKK